MKQKPPHYNLDQETRRFTELVAYYARELASIQQSPNTDMMSVIETVEARLGLTPPDDQTQTSCDVVPLRPFRVITTNKSETQDEPR